MCERQCKRWQKRNRRKKKENREENETRRQNGVGKVKYIQKILLKPRWRGGEEREMRLQ
jgi:hypothetical protein